MIDATARARTVQALGLFLLVSFLSAGLPATGNNRGGPLIVASGSAAVSSLAQHVFVELLVLGEPTRKGAISSGTPLDRPRSPISPEDVDKGIAAIVAQKVRPDDIRSRLIAAGFGGNRYRIGQILIGVKPLTRARLQSLLEALQSAEESREGLWMMRLVTSEDSCYEQNRLQAAALRDSTNRVAYLAAILGLRVGRRVVSTSQLNAAARDVASFCGDEWPPVPDRDPFEIASWGNELPRYYTGASGTTSYKTFGVLRISTHEVPAHAAYSSKISEQSDGRQPLARIVLTARSKVAVQPSWILVSITANKGSSLLPAVQALRPLALGSAAFVDEGEQLFLHGSVADGSLGRIRNALSNMHGIDFEEIPVIEHCEKITSWLDALALRDALSRISTRPVEIAQSDGYDGALYPKDGDDLDKVGARVHRYLELNPEYSEFPLAGVQAEFSRTFIVTADGSQR